MGDPLERSDAWSKILPECLRSMRLSFTCGQYRTHGMTFSLPDGSTAFAEGVGGPFVPAGARRRHCDTNDLPISDAGHRYFLAARSSSAGNTIGAQPGGVGAAQNRVYARGPPVVLRLRSIASPISLPFGRGCECRIRWTGVRSSDEKIGGGGGNRRSGSVWPYMTLDGPTW